MGYWSVTFGGLGCDWLVLSFDWSSHKWVSCVFTCFVVIMIFWEIDTCTHTLYIKSHILLIMEGALFLILGICSSERQSFFERRLKAGIQQLHESWKSTSLFRGCKISEKATQFFKMMNYLINFFCINATYLMCMFVFVREGHKVKSVCGLSYLFLAMLI